MYQRTDKVFEKETKISQTYSSQAVGLNKLNSNNNVHIVFKRLIESQSEPIDKSPPTPLYDCVSYGTSSDSLNKENNITSDTQSILADGLTGQYMIGSIAVGIYLIESTGSQEDWWAAAEQITFNEIVEGLDWLSEEANQRGVKVVWVYAPVEKISTTLEPIMGNHKTFDDPVPNWLFDILSAHNEPSSWEGAYGLANKLRKAYKTNWAVELAIVMDENDADNMFADQRFGYFHSPESGAEHRGPLVVMTYNNDGWGATQMNKVTAHEVGHVFGASDEYANSNCDCGIGNSYLQTINGNCETCNSNAIDCVMNGNSNVVCNFSSHEFGWRDTDGDNVADPIDPNTGEFCWINPVVPGDLLQIYDVGGLFTNTISVTEDMLVGANLDVILWDGSTYDNLTTYPGFYSFSKNGGPNWTEILNLSGSSTPTISNHNYNLDIVSYKNDDPIYVRHTIYDSVGSIYSRPQFDEMKNSQSTINSDISSYTDGIYTSKVFSWAPYGGVSNTSTLQFINYICGDIDNSGSVDVSDMTYLTSYMFESGTAPVHMASADIVCNGDIDISDLIYLVAYMFQGGPAPECCHSL